MLFRTGGGIPAAIRLFLSLFRKRIRVLTIDTGKKKTKTFVGNLFTFFCKKETGTMNTQNLSRLQRKNPINFFQTVCQQFTNQRKLSENAGQTKNWRI